MGGFSRGTRVSPVPDKLGCLSFIVGLTKLAREQEKICTLSSSASHLAFQHMGGDGRMGSESPTRGRPGAPRSQLERPRLSIPSETGKGGGVVPTASSRHSLPQPAASQTPKSRISPGLLFPPVGTGHSWPVSWRTEPGPGQQALPPLPTCKHTHVWCPKPSHSVANQPKTEDPQTQMF